MTPAALVADGLWRCLCPPFRKLPVASRTRLLYPRLFRSAVHPRLRIGPQQRSSSTAAAQTQESDYDAFGAVDAPSEPQPRPNPNRALPSRNDRPAPVPRGFGDPEAHIPDAFQRPADRHNHFDQMFDYPIENIYALLHRVAYETKFTPESVERVEDLVNHLVRDRSEKPNPRIYAASIIVNANAENGSAAAAAALIKEMGEEGLEPTSEICHNVLKVLAVHPDYLLRNAILEYMRQRWFEITTDGHCDIIVGLLRERQFELAIDKLEALARNTARVASWVYDMAMYILIEADEVDEALRILRFRLETTNSFVSPNIWYLLLDAASANYNLVATDFVWRLRVVPGYLNPPTGICYNVLSTAARHGDPYLATEVFRVMGERKEPLSQSHYEPLIEAYARADDPETAASVACIMNAACCVPDKGSVMPVLEWANASPERPLELFETLAALQEEGQKVPTCLMDCAIEATLNQGNLEQGIEFYKALSAICADGPGTHTFNVLLRHCQTRKDLAMFLAGEMVELGVAPDVLTYDRLLLACLRQPGDEDFNDAVRYYEEMKVNGWVPRAGTFKVLAVGCAQRRDPRAWEVLHDMEKAGIGKVRVADAKNLANTYWGNSEGAAGEVLYTPGPPQKEEQQSEPSEAEMAALGIL